MEIHIPTDYQAILDKIDEIDPVKYALTRNYIDGAVTRLSPYISRGVISTKQILKSLLDKGYAVSQIESFVKELCWRDYFQRVAQAKDVNVEIKHPQAKVSNFEISSSIVHATTGILALDTAIQELYQNGYMHNHCRMYIASLACNIAHSHWHHPAQWMYYHLLDGDWASNACSWQWVAGANSNKKYYANQENINKFTHTAQTNTFLDLPYEEIETMETPSALLATQRFNLDLHLPHTIDFQYNKSMPTFLYNYYNLDPSWHQEQLGNRVLLLEPDVFKKYSISKKCFDFMIALSKNIAGIQVYVGSFQSFVDQYDVQNIYYKEHPLNQGYVGIQDERDWIVENISGYYPSFFAYWKQVEKQLNP